MSVVHINLNQLPFVIRLWRPQCSFKLNRESFDMTVCYQNKELFDMAVCYQNKKMFDVTRLLSE